MQWGQAEEHGMRQHAGCEHGAQVVECQQLSQGRGLCVCVQAGDVRGQGAGGRREDRQGNGCV